MNRRTRLVAGSSALLALAAIGLSAAQAAPFGFTNDRSAELAKQIDSAKPRNVILIIGDGTDDSIITAARNYELGAAGRFALDELPFTGEMTTFGLKTAPDGTRYPINYVSDSAPTASGWSTGKKTVDGRLSQGPSSGEQVPGTDYETVLETYAKQGKRTGNVSTAEITDATPAAAASHINARACQGPANMATCPTAVKTVGGTGKGSIAEQLVDNEVDVLLGGGAQRYAQTLASGQTVLDYAKTTRGYQSVTDKAGLAAGTSVAAKPVIGLFATGNMTPRYSPLPIASPAGAGGPDTTCATADRGTQPTLAEMTDKAIALLDNPNGFFLQVESAMIDKQEHAADACGAIGDVLEMDNALKVAQAYQKTHPDTLIIVTGDHAHSTQIVPNNLAGKATTTVKTKDGDPMTIAYSTADTTAPGFSMTHTGAQIRVAASGPQAANVTGTIDQTDLYLTLLGRTPSQVGGGTTTPTAPAVKPVVAVAAAPQVRRADARKGIKVQVSAGGATSVTVTVSRGGKVLDDAVLPGTGGTVKLKPGKKAKGTLTVTATATGAGGTTTATTTVKVKR